MDAHRPSVVLSTIGSLGDLYPVLSIARALRRMDVAPRLVLPPDDCAVARDWGLAADPVGPTQAELCRRLGMTRDEIAASVLHDPGPMLRDGLLPLLPSMTRAVRALCVGASVVAGTTFALPAALAAEQADLPYVPLMLQPMMAFSAADPPRARGFGIAVRHGGAPGRAWNRGVMGLARAVLRLRHGSDLAAARAALGLPRQAGTPLLDHDAATPFRLGLWDPVFAPAPPDGPPGLEAVGFPPAPVGTLTDAQRAWLDAGPAPLVVTLGSIAQGLGGPRFWEDAARLARRLGLRAVLLHGEATAPGGPDVLSVPYAPHAQLFPRAAAIVHHGGIGTTAEALRAARPQLILPVGGDQPDNAARVARLGLGGVLPLRRFDSARAEPRLARLLDRFDYAHAARLGRRIAATDGAAEAATRLAELAARTSRAQSAN